MAIEMIQNELQNELQALDFENFEIEDIADVALHAPALAISICSSSSSCSSTSSSCSSGCSSSVL
jgi:thiazolylpeptide-type bacteriocin precursor